MTWRIALLSSRGQVTVALMLGVYLTIGSRSHFAQLLNYRCDDAGAGDCAGNTFSAMNTVYQTAYAAVQVPAFLFADRIDPVPVLGAVSLGAAVTSSIAPFAFRALGSGRAATVLLGALFAANGVLGGCWWPSMNIMLANWAPATELAYMYATINTGVPGGIVLGNAFVGLVYGVRDSAFRYSFFIVTAICALWGITWLSTFYWRPADDPGCGPDELRLLSENTRPKNRDQSLSVAVPWRQMAVSPAVLSVLVANFGSTVFYTVLVFYGPKYLKNVTRVDVSKNGFMSAVPPLSQMLVMYAAGCCASYAQRRTWTNVANIRKLFTLVGMAVPACLLFATAALNTSQSVFYYTLVAAYAVSGFVFSGFRVSQMELAPNFVAAITAAGDLVGSLAMATVNAAFYVGVGELTEQATWNRICWATSAVLVLTAGPFLLVGSSETQPWNSANRDGPIGDDGEVIVPLDS